MASQPPPDEYDHREEGLFPRFGDVVVDRGRRQVSARCMWKIKPDYQRKGTKK